MKCLKLNKSRRKNGKVQESADQADRSDSARERWVNGEQACFSGKDENGDVTVDHGSGRL